MDDLPDNEKRRHINNFLRDIKALIGEGRYLIRDRVKNRNSLIELGLTERQRDNVILSLSVEDYCSGPEKDEFKRGDYWVFGKAIDGVEVYIKLQIVSDRHDEHAICLSFHRAEWSLKFPFGKNSSSY